MLLMQKCKLNTSVLIPVWIHTSSAIVHLKSALSFSHVRILMNSLYKLSFALICFGVTPLKSLVFFPIKASGGCIWGYKSCPWLSVEALQRVRTSQKLLVSHLSVRGCPAFAWETGKCSFLLACMQMFLGLWLIMFIVAGWICVAQTFCRQHGSGLCGEEKGGVGELPASGCFPPCSIQWQDLLLLPHWGNMEIVNQAPSLSYSSVANSS